ncbi:bis-aminopropyl spermidine synthase family protein, partial [Myxococcota bacterium]
MAETDSNTPIYRLGDGVVIGIGGRAAVLVNLRLDDEIKIADAQYAEVLDKLALGWTMEGWEDFIPRMLKEGIIAEGDLQVDPIIREHLARLDTMFMAGFRDQLTERARHAYELTLTAHAWRKRFFTQVGQCPTLPETTLRRALLVGDAEQVGKLDILCVGDDDLVSIPLAALGHRVTVYDIDPFLLTLLEQVSASLSLDIAVIERNLLEPLARDEQDRWDVFVTDPMSNRECFEIFLSRALAMTRPGGRGFVAVYGPACRLFGEISTEMRFPIKSWYARHNRYYSQYFKLHSYESDWVEVKRANETTVKHGPEEAASPESLYAEAYFQRPPTFCAFYDEIEDPHHAKPMFLDAVVDMLEAGTGLKLEGKIVHAGKGWSV